MTFINNLVASLKENAELQAFCNARWGKSLTVEFVFRKKAVIHLSEFPIILITRPSVRKSLLTNVQRDSDNTLSLRCLFLQNDPVQGAIELIEFEEYIDDALLKPEPETLGAVKITPEESINDEGANHPEYYLAMLVQVHHRR